MMSYECESLKKKSLQAKWFFYAFHALERSRWNECQDKVKGIHEELLGSDQK